MPDLDDGIRTPGRGFFVTLEGPDGGGKTTQATALAGWIEAQGRRVTACREPGGTALGERVRSLLLDRSGFAFGLRSEMLLYMASRAQLVEEVIEPALAAGSVVVSDRYLLSSVVYQGYAGGLPVEEIWRVGRVATHGVVPDLTLVLDVPPEVARARIGAPRDRIEDRPDAFRARVRDGFLRAARGEAVGFYPGRITIIDGDADPETVASRLRSEVAHALALDPRP